MVVGDPCHRMSAFAAHPKIVDHKAVEDKPAAFAAFSRTEQAAAATTTSSEVTAELQSWNKAYNDKFGFIFIICAKARRWMTCAIQAGDFICFVNAAGKILARNTWVLEGTLSAPPLRRAAGCSTGTDEDHRAAPG
jgi:2-oxo-4-hydroxy-4-carboxy--5-ureidoimidazoline (OHCU) decarboxylase